MSYFLVAAIVALIGTVPLLLRKLFISAALVGTVYTLVFWGMIWLGVPGTFWPLATPISLLGFVAWVISTFVASSTREADANELATPLSVGGAALYLVAIFGIWIASSGMFRANDYASLLGSVEKRHWTTIVQPKSPEHIRMMGNETALYIARKAVANNGNIGSQFSIDEEHLTLQRVKGELVYIVPLDFRGFSQWSNTAGVPAYIMVNAEDPEAAARLVTLKGTTMHYTPGAYFGNNLKRYLREHGLLNVGLAEMNFEIDDNGQPWWIVPTYHPTIGWDGLKIDGVTIVNPVTGEIIRYTTEKAPVWIDRIVPESFIQNYLEWNGEYTGGWLNSWWGTEGLTKPEGSHLFYGSDDRAQWVTGITSSSNNDDSLVAIAYTDSRTGKTVIYNVGGGATDTAIIDAVNANKDVNYKKLHGAAVQIYNIYGRMAAVVPLLNSSGAYQEVAIADVKNPQDVVVGRDQVEALRNYQSMLYRKGQQVAVSNESDVKHIEGKVDRFALDVGENGSAYLLHLVGKPMIFTASSRDSIKVPLTQVGDLVSIDYVASGEGQVPVKRFDNLSLPLEQTPEQTRLEARVDTRQRVAEKRVSAEDTRKRISDMSDDEVAMLLKKKQ